MEKKLVLNCTANLPASSSFYTPNLGVNFTQTILGIVSSLDRLRFFFNARRETDETVMSLDVVDEGSVDVEATKGGNVVVDIASPESGVVELPFHAKSRCFGGFFGRSTFLEYKRICKTNTKTR